MSVETISDADLDLLLLIRSFESALLELFAAGEVSGTTHTCLGQEYIPVALAPLLAGDFVFSNHRGHGHYIAHTGDAVGLLAEILGREGAPCQGVGGSQHLHRENYLSTGVQGESLPAAVGVALHLKRATADRIAVAYIGDGTWGEGSVYEALNMASLWRAPLLVVVENNAIAQSTPIAGHLAGTIAGRAAAFDVAYHRVLTNDIHAIRVELAPLIAVVRDQRTPLVVEFETVRLGPHSKGDDTRDADDLTQLRDRDWCASYARACGERFAQAQSRQRDRVAELVSQVRQRPLATWEAR
jgi:pyruvate dehydrogenase E1 component alpha subunit